MTSDRTNPAQPDNEDGTLSYLQVSINLQDLYLILHFSLLGLESVLVWVHK